MKKHFLLLVIGLCSVFPFVVKADINSETSGSGSCSGNNFCWNSTGKINGKSKALRAMRVTLFNEKAERVSDSIDISLNYDLSSYSTYNVIRSNSLISKIEYMNGVASGDKSTWSNGNLSDLYILSPSDIANFWNASEREGTSVQDQAAHYFEAGGFDRVSQIKQALQICGAKYHSKCNTEHYYAVFEPTTVISHRTTNYYGTSYELAKNFYNPNRNFEKKIRRDFQNFLYITGQYPDFYRNAGIWSVNGDYNLHKYRIGMQYTYDEIMHFGVGMSVIEWTDKIDRDAIIPLTKEFTCDVNVNMTECGETSISEASQKDCIVNNDVYSYIPSCNLYCSDKIVTDFRGFYTTFIGNNAFGAIKSGKYLAIKSNPKITITKTCYQNGPSNECPNVIGALQTKMIGENPNKIYLNVDGIKYDLIGSKSDPVIKLKNDDNGIEATITYEYKLDENINKYINIETMKGALNPSDKTYTNEGPTIITSKGSYGEYTYNLDVSETPINKYNVASKALRNIKKGKYNYINNLKVTYTSGNKNQKDNYTLDDLKNNSCTYYKYNTDEGCIGVEDKCVDSVTCEVLDSCDVCECTGKYGCLDDGKCTPITDPKTDGDGKDVCDPEQKTCFPNLIYRPISLVEPFPGVDGKTRTPGNNWNKIYKTSDGRVYSYGDYYIRQRRGYKDYEIYQADPLYVIRLDGNKIQAIRTYNKTHNYNDFDLTCINGENCISNFLRGKANGFTINLIDSGTCKDITNHNFDSCIKNKGEQ